MRKDVLKKFRETLLGMKSQLLDDLPDRLKQEVESTKDEGRDTYDLASDERDREINMILNDRERTKLMAIEDALARLGEGSYGECEECGEDIGVGRLKVMPFTRLCVRCQEELERESRMMKNFDEDRTFRRLATNDTEEESY
ncbi:MAG: TraR/DksA family transcriptional regulator [Deltaproteobacteria bacterium]|nr:TraR/DksA family transcriptional regulator [Deltaproteobacteria bacterium]MDE0341672.1 TraR/DksA family transcriptional regulator [Deltaproteobacteria bacterium]